MAQALPLTKLAGLLMKTLAKPLSKRIKHEFSRYGATQRLLVGIGQASHQVTSRMTIWSSGYRVRSISPLEEDKALKTGAEFVGESFIVLVSGGIIVWEYNRSSKEKKEKEAISKAKTKAEKEALYERIAGLENRVLQLEESSKRKEERIQSVSTSAPSTNDSATWGWLGWKPRS